MIALGETLEAAAEVPFFLASTADPTVGVTAHVFVLGEVQVNIPGSGAWASVLVAKVREIGFGQYAARLTASQCVTAGTVYCRAVITGAQPTVVSESIGTTGGDIALLSDGVIPFFLPNSGDPIFGAAVTGHVFVLGEVKVALPDLPFSNALTSKIVEVGFGSYAYQLRNADGDTTTRGKVYLFANVSGAQKYLGYVMILGSSSTTLVVTPPAIAPTVYASPNISAGVTTEDHVTIAVSRLLAQHRFPAVN